MEDNESDEIEDKYCQICKSLFTNSDPDIGYCENCRSLTHFEQELLWILQDISKQLKNINNSVGGGFSLIQK